MLGAQLKFCGGESSFLAYQLAVTDTSGCVRVSRDISHVHSGSPSCIQLPWDWYGSDMAHTLGVWLPLRSFSGVSLQEVWDAGCEVLTPIRERYTVGPRCSGLIASTVSHKTDICYYLPVYGPAYHSHFICLYSIDQGGHFYLSAFPVTAKEAVS